MTTAIKRSATAVVALVAIAGLLAPSSFAAKPSPPACGAAHNGTSSVLFAARKPKPPGGGATMSCLDARIAECKRDPTKTPGYCDSPQARIHYRIICAMWGPPKSGPAAPPPIATARLGAAV